MEKEEFMNTYKKLNNFIQLSFSARLKKEQFHTNYFVRRQFEGCIPKSYLKQKLGNRTWQQSS